MLNALLWLARADVPGVKEEKGCPKKYSLVVVTKERIEIKKQIKFATGSAKIVGAESMYVPDILRRLAAGMRARAKEILPLEVDRARRRQDVMGVLLLNNYGRFVTRRRAIEGRAMRIPFS